MTVWLITWFWQGTALTLAAALCLKHRRLNAATRHHVWWAVLFAVIWLGAASSPYRDLAPQEQRPAPHRLDFAAEPLIPVQEAPPLVISIVLGVWAAIALVSLLRLLPSLRNLYRLRDRCRPFPSDVEARLPLWLEAKAQGRGADLVICDAVAGATVLGFHRPCIALPSSLVAALDTEEIDQVVLHEYAHVRRRDDWTRLLQALLQAALWIHPAVAFIGRTLNRQREIACDDWVVARTGLPKAYARCLAHAAEVRGRVRVAPVLMPTLLVGEHDLVRRVNRLLAIKGKTRRRVSLAAVTVAACSIVVFSSHLKTVPLVGESVLSVLPEVAALAAPSAVPGARPVALREPADAQDREPAFALRASTFALRSLVDETADKTGDWSADEPAETAGQPARAFNGVLEESAGHRDMNPGPGTPEPLGQPLAARSFEGAYTTQDAASSTSDSASVWGAAATPGLAIADVARKTGVGLASAFSRASVAVARRF